MYPIRVAVKAWSLSVLVLTANHAWTALPPLPPVPEEERCKVYPNDPNDGPRAMQMFSGLVAGAVLNLVGAVLEQRVNEWNSSSCLLDDGRPRLTALIPGYSEAFRYEKDWSKSLHRVNTLRQQYPKSPFAALAQAQYWIDHAWEARGSGYASSVAPDAWKLFRERLEKAEQVLTETKSYASELPNWYVQMITVQSTLDRPAGERDKTFLEGTKKFKTFQPIYFTMLNFLSPKWGGSWGTVDNLVKWSVENTKDTEGDTMYARLYWAASSGLPEGENVFKSSRASWQKMKKGFEDLMTRYPKSKWNLNNFARFACLAGDKKTFLALRRQVGKDVIHDAWPRNTSVDLCDNKFGYAK